MTNVIHATLYTALRNRDLEATACLIHHLSAIDPEAAQRIRDALAETEARLRAERGALEARDWADELQARRDEWWGE